MKAILCTGLKAVASAVVFDWYWIDDKVSFQAALFFHVSLPIHRNRRQTRRAGHNDSTRIIIANRYENP